MRHHDPLRWEVQALYYLESSPVDKTKITYTKKVKIKKENLS